MGKRPNFGGMGMGNMQGLIKQAKKMQQQMEAEQAIHLIYLRYINRFIFE